MIMACISDYLTHFVGRTQPDDDARCDLLVKILRARTLGQWNKQGRIRISPGSMQISVDGSLCKDEFIHFSPVCFCDIPEENPGRHTRFYGQFGLAFKKECLVAKGANPVFYIAKGGPQILRVIDCRRNAGSALRIL
jgi:hypothetical protein